MSAFATDVARKAAPPFADMGIGRGWEPAALLVTTLLLVSLGLVTLYSASALLAQRQDLPDTFYVLRQAVGVGIGLVLLVVCSRIPHGWWRALAWPGVFASFVLLVLIVLPATETLAPEINGARRSLDLGVSFQPTELAKLAILVWTAHTAVRKSEQLRSLFRGFLPFLLVWGALLTPILLQPDLSTAFVAGLCGAVVLFAAGGRIAHFVLLSLVVGPLVLAQLGEGFRQARMMAFGDVEEFAAAEGYQVHQSLIAIGSGGITGVGFGEGRQKFGFLPEPHNDFIFAMIGEEWGLLGVTVLLGLYLTLVLVGFRIARGALDPFGQLLAIGITSMIALQALLHIGVGLGVVPPTGLSLPLVSYGRSNLLVSMTGVGMLLSIGRSMRGSS